MSKDALLEIGSEELPASFIGPAMRQLKTFAETALPANGLTFTSIESFGTPRRLAVVIHGLSERSSDQTKVVTGPSAAASKDAQGHWTPAAMGFARKHGLKPSELKIDKDRLVAELHIKGVAARQLLSDLFPQWISKLEFPKSMEWESGHFHYPRPIRWLCAIYGADLVSMTVAGVKSARWTLGLGPWSPKKIPMTHAGKYALLLKNQCVLVDTLARRESIQRSAEQVAKRAHGKVILSTALLEQVANLVEHPVAILGNFDAAYLDLPKEVLVTCLEHHQKYFPVEQASGGKLLPHFVGIRNGMSIHQEIVREGYERVLAARLADARFFYTQDRRAPLASKVDALKGVMFQAKLGSLYDKKERVKQLLETIAARLPDFADLEKAERTADLCKADLVTDMVREFPELQGIVARLYAKEDGEDAVVVKAVEEHYWPITMTGALPSSDVAALVALADKLDTLAGDFAIGLIPSGSADPYGLRRAAVGVLRILEDRKWPLNLEAILKDAMEGLHSEVFMNAAREGVHKKLIQFMHQRFSSILIEQGFKVDEVEAVLATGIGLITSTKAKLQALHNFRKLPEFEALSNSFKRASNIVRQAREKNIAFNAGDSPQVELLQEECEKTLWNAYTDVEGKLQDTLGYEKVLKEMVPLREPLAKFFEGVMVMVEDESIRLNRLRLLYKITNLFHGVADFSKLQNG